MIIVKNNEQLKLMREAGRITGEALRLAGDAVRPGVTTKELDEKIRTYIEKAGARPSFLGYGGFPASACISINNEVIHGIPSGKRHLQEGDIVKIDVGALYRGYNGDSANTFAVGKISPSAQKLIDVTRESFFSAFNVIKSAIEKGDTPRLGDVGYAVDSYAVANGYQTVRKYVGHGVGRALHEDPQVPNYGTPGRGARLTVGMTIAIEPMINEGTYQVLEQPDGWTVLTADGKLSAHYEHTVAITADGPVLLTWAD